MIPTPRDEETGHERPDQSRRHRRSGGLQGPVRQSAGHRRLRVRGVHLAGAGAAQGPVREDGLHRRLPAPLQARASLSPGRHQLHPEHGALGPAGRFPRRPRPVRQRHGLPRARRRQGVPAGGRAGRDPGHRTGRPHGAQHPGDPGDRRIEPLSRRPLRRAGDLRRRLPADRGRRGGGSRERRRPHLPRPPDPQRPPRPDGDLGRVLRAHLQLPRDPLLRHRGQADRAGLQGHDQPGRQDPHPAEREPGRAFPDRGVPEGLQGRGDPAHRAWDRRHL